MADKGLSFCEEDLTPLITWNGIARVPERSSPVINGEITCRISMFHFLHDQGKIPLPGPGQRLSKKGYQFPILRIDASRSTPPPQHITPLRYTMQFMKHFGTRIVILFIALLLSAGCTQSSPSPSLQPVTTVVTQSATPTTPAETPVSVVTASVPQVTVTVIHYIVPLKAWKDAELHMAFKAPQDWTVNTRLVSLPDGSQGLMYQTDLIANDVFSIRTYPISLNQDQAYRDEFRKWGPAPAESTVTINGIRYDRFETSNNGKTHVGYVAQKSSANDLGYASVLVYTADASRPFEKEDFENVVSSFAYFTKDRTATVQGEEIPRVR